MYLPISARHVALLRGSYAAPISLLYLSLGDPPVFLEGRWTSHSRFCTIRNMSIVSSENFTSWVPLPIIIASCRVKYICCVRSNCGTVRLFIRPLKYKLINIFCHHSSPENSLESSVRTHQRCQFFFQAGTKTESFFRLTRDF